MANGSNGIADLLLQPLTLEERIEAHLKRAPTVSQLADDYADPADRQNVRHRALISAVLNACFEHGFPDGDADFVQVEQEPAAWGELADTRNAFNRDAHRLNNGNKAESCLSPIPKESIIPTNTIGSDRELLIVWLAAIEVWEERRDGNLFANRKAVFDAAANACGTKPSSYKTNRSTMKRNLKGKGSRFSKVEQEIYESLVKAARTDAAVSNGAPSAFAILFPAARALAERKTPVKLSADKLKG